jgi:hypothetical protein
MQVSKFRRRKSATAYVVIFLVVLVAAAGFFAWFRINSIRGSNEFKSERANILFISKANNNVGYFMSINSTKRVVYVVEIPDKLYNSVTMKNFDVSDPYNALSFVEDLLSLKADYNYYAVLDGEKMNKFTEQLVGMKMNNFYGFLDELSKRGLKFTDYFTLGSIVKPLRPDTNINEQILAKMISSYGSFNIRKYSVPTVTKDPVTITVRDRTFQRLYLDQDGLKMIKDELSK